MSTEDDVETGPVVERSTQSLRGQRQSVDIEWMAASREQLRTALSDQNPPSSGPPPDRAVPGLGDGPRKPAREPLPGRGGPGWSKSTLPADSGGSVQPRSGRVAPS